LTSEEKTLKDRWCKKNEAEEFPEDQLEVLKADGKANKERRAYLTS
jgi:hypothetical protein